jgi:hypothetical protein
MGHDLKQIDIPYFTCTEDAPAGHAPISSRWPTETASRDRERVRGGVKSGAIEASYLKRSSKGAEELWVHIEQAERWLGGWQPKSPSKEKPSDKGKPGNDLEASRLAVCLEALVEQRRLAVCLEVLVEQTQILNEQLMELNAAQRSAKASRSLGLL